MTLSEEGQALIKALADTFPSKEEMRLALQESEERTSDRLLQGMRETEERILTRIDQGESEIVDHIEEVRGQLDRSFIVREEDIRRDTTPIDRFGEIESRVKELETQVNTLADQLARNGKPDHAP